MFIDIAVARKLESVEEVGCVRFAETIAKQKPELGCAVEEIAGGHAAFAGIGSPLSHALALGLQGPVSKEVVVSPYADPSLMAELGQRPYRLTEWNNVYYRRVERPAAAPDPRLEIRRVRSGEERMWAELVGRCFATDPANLQVIVELFSAMGG